MSAYQEQKVLCLRAAEAEFLPFSNLSSAVLWWSWCSHAILCNEN